MIGENDCGEEMRTKVSIVRVCGLWWHLAIGLLYEFIRIRESSALHLLVKALEGLSSDRFYAQNDRPLGWYVKRILIERRASWKDGSSIKLSMTKLFHLCSELLILGIIPTYDILGINPTYDMPLKFDVISGRASALRFCRIEWTGEYQFTDFFHPLLLQLQRFGVLEVLHMTSSSHCPGLEDQAWNFLSSILYA
jgi:hypothetical protein